MSPTRALLHSGILLVAVGHLACAPSTPTAVGAEIRIEATHPTPTRGPLRVLAANPRYFTDDGTNAVLLAGAHTWNNLQDWGTSNPPPTFDYPGYLTFLRRHGLNFFRLWTWEQAWSYPIERAWFTPLPYLRPGPGVALDGGPKFDLRQLSPEYFRRLRQRVLAAGQEGIYVSIMLFNGSSRGAPMGHPFNRHNNVNGVDGDPNGDGNMAELHSLADPDITAFQQAYVKTAIEAVSDLDNVLWEISNESDSGSQDWQYAMIRSIKEDESARGKPHPVGMSVEYPDGSNAELFASPADWISPTKTPSEPYRDNPPVATGQKVIVSDTDHLWGIGGNASWVWKTFLRGLHPVLMDPYDATLVDLVPIYGEVQSRGARRWSRTDSPWKEIRQALGQIRYYAQRVRLAEMTPQAQLASSGYCLANRGSEYLVYLPAEPGWVRRRLGQVVRGLLAETVTVDLAGTTGSFTTEWFSPGLQMRFAGDEVRGGAPRELTAPFAGDAVLHLEATSQPAPR